MGVAQGQKSGNLTFVESFICGYVETSHTSNHCGDSLDSVGQDGEAYEDSHRSVQVPHHGLVLEHLSADEDGEAHDGPHQGVEAWKETHRSQLRRRGRIL